MKRLYVLLLSAFISVCTFAQGWPTNYGGVMLQGFSWDSYVDTQWSNLESQSDELSKYFSLIWVPQSGNCNTSWNVMGYTPVYYFNQNSSFGTESQLRSMIKTFKSKGTGIIADVVVNHRNNLGVNGSWVDYPAETYKGVTYQMKSTDITGNDDGGATKNWATQNGYTLGNNDEGEDWSGCRDLDHTSSNVQNILKVYAKYLVDDLGYTGFRYDMVKGFNGSHVADYNTAAGVQYSVGEYWDGNQAIENWINATGKKSAAFDFQFRYNVRDAINANDWGKLKSDNNLMHDANYRQYAVTFVENHDMQDRGNVTGYTKDPIVRDTLAANAYLLTMPGTPCVFLPHWKAYKQEIKAMIDLRKQMGITNMSNYTVWFNTAAYAGVSVKGTNGELFLYVGKDVNSKTFNGYTKVLSGYHYNYLAKNTSEMAFVDKASGEYSNAFDVTLTAVSANSAAQLVYTLDGTTPTASNGTKVASGKKINISSSETLKVGLLVNGTVSKVITREYVVKPFVAHKATVYLKDPNWTNVYFYAWANNSSNTQLLGGWPGTKMTATTTVNGEKYYYRAFDINTADYSFNIIFNQGSGQKQTVDIGPITEDTYYEIANEVGGKFTVNNITSSVTGIENVELPNEELNSDAPIFNFAGQRVNKDYKGIVIKNGKKYLAK